MSSTNKTNHYNLPQFIGSDIPTWLGDFNSAMTAIDSGINAAATSASRAATDAATAQKSANDALKAANRCPFPVGYGGFFQTNPNSIYAGTTWEQKKDVFILASGATYGAGSTGGEAQHTLTTAEMPKHTHIQNIQVSNLGTTSTILKGSDGKGTSSGPSNVVQEDWINNGIALETYSNGSGEPHNNMPPYYAMPFWLRTA